MSEVKELVNELKSEWVTKEDFDNLGNLSNLNHEQIKQKIASFDEKEGLSSAEQKLYDILKQIDWIKILAQVTENFKKIENLEATKENLLEQLKNKTETIKSLNRNNKELNIEKEKVEVEVINIKDKKTKFLNNIWDIWYKIKEIKAKIDNWNISKEESNKLLVELNKYITEINTIKKKNDINNFTEKALERKDKQITEKITNWEKEINIEKKSIDILSEQVSNITEKEYNITWNIDNKTEKLNIDISKISKQFSNNFSQNYWKIKNKYQFKNLDISENTINSILVNTETEAKELMVSFLEQLKSNKNSLLANSKIINEQKIDFFKTAPENIRYITDESKLEKVLTHLKSDTIKKHFRNFINPEFLDNIKILSLYHLKSSIDIDTKDIKNIDFENLDNKNNKLIFLNILKEKTLVNFLINNYLTTELNILIEKKEYLNLIPQLEKAKKIILNKNTFNNFSFENFSFENYNSTLLDNTLVSELEENSQKVFNLFEWKNIDKLYQFPKLSKNIIYGVDKNIKNMIKTEPSFYDKFLPRYKQISYLEKWNSKTDYSVIYLNTLIKKNKATPENIAKVKFRDIKNAINIFSQLNKINWIKKNMNNILKQSSVRSELTLLAKRSEQEWNSFEKLNLTEGEKETFKEMQKIINLFFNDTFKQYENKYNKITEKFNVNAFKLDKQTSAIKNILENTKYSLYKEEIKNIINFTLDWNKEEVQKSIKKLSDIMWVDRIKDFEKSLKDIIEKIKELNTEKAWNFFEKQNEKTQKVLIENNILDKNWKLTQKKFKEFEKYIINNSKIIDWDKEKALRLFLEQNQYQKLKLSPEVITEIKRQINTSDSIKIIVKTKEKFKNASPQEKRNLYKQLQNENSDFFNNIDKEIEEDIKLEILNWINGDNKNNEYWNDLNNINYDFAENESWETFSLTTDWVTINDVTKEEKKQIDNNPEALKNFVNMKQQLDLLDIPFAWKNRKILINEMNKISEFNTIVSTNKTEGSNILTKEWFNNYLKFLIKLTWNEYSTSSLNENYINVRRINKESATWENVHTASGLKPFWYELMKKKIINNSWIINLGWLTEKIKTIISETNSKKSTVKAVQ